jgi:hypothetical protein
MKDKENRLAKEEKYYMRAVHICKSMAENES